MVLGVLSTLSPVRITGLTLTLYWLLRVLRRRRRHAYFIIGVLFHAGRGAFRAFVRRLRRGKPRLPRWSIPFELANEVGRAVVKWGQDVLWDDPRYVQGRGVAKAVTQRQWQDPGQLHLGRGCEV